MKKEERIARYGEDAYEKHLEQSREWAKAHPKEHNTANRKWREAHPDSNKNWREKNKEKMDANNKKTNRKDGKYYDQKLEYMRTGIPGERCRIRVKHAHQYKPYKAIIAQESQIHHEWVPDTSEYRGIALVEKEQHMHGFVDVIEILDGEITLLTEEEVKKGKRIE